MTTTCNCDPLFADFYMSETISCIYMTIIKLVLLKRSGMLPHI